MISFEESIDPLTTFLSGHGFSITKKEEYLVEYASPTVTIRIGYASLEQTFYMYIGGDPTSLTELAPDAVKEVFGNNRFSFQSMLTIDNLIRFLNSTGKPILLGNKNILERLKAFEKQRAKKYTGQILAKQTKEAADKAWQQQDYESFIKYIEGAERSSLSPSYLKKYKIALSKINGTDMM